MTNLVEITIKASDDTASGFSAIRTKAAKAGDEAAKAFNDAFKLRADASGSAKERLETTGSLGGEDKQLMNKLKGYANTPGGIGLLGTGNDTSLVSMLKRQIQSAGESGGLGLLGGSSQSGQSLQDTVRQQLTGNGPQNVSTTDLIKQVIEGSSPSNYSTKDFISQVLQGNSPGNINTEDLIKQVLQGARPGNITTDDFIKQVLQGHAPSNVSTTNTIRDIEEGDTPHDSETTNVIHEKIDDAGVADQGKKDGDTYGKSFASSVKNALSSLLGGKGGGGGISSLLTGGGGGGDDSKLKSTLNSGGIAGGALPGIAGISGMAATITGLAGALVAVLPAITSVIGGLGAIGGGFAILEATDKKFAKDMSSTMSGIEKVFEDAAQPLVKPLEQAATQIGGFFKGIEPQLKQVFGDSAQLIQPLVKGFEALMSGAGPGFLAMIKAAGPVFQTMGQAFGNLGKSLGEMFKDFASDGAGSATILKGFLDIINSLLPFIGELGKIMVSALAPAFTAFSGALSAVLPALTPLLKILGSLAGAVMSDLGSVLEALGALLVGLAPSFTLLAKVASNLFNTLENTGIFAILGDALESLASPLSNLVNAIVKGLAPALPGLLTAFSDLAGVLTGGIVTAIGIIANALADIIKAIPPAALTVIVDGIVAIYGAMKVWAAVSALLDATNPFIAIAAAVVIVAGIVIKYHTQIWDFIVKTWHDIYDFLKTLWGDIESFAEQWWPLLLGPAGLIVKYHNDIWQFIQKIWNGILSFLKTLWGDILSFAEQWWPLLLGPSGLIVKYHNDIWQFIQKIWNDVLSFLKGLWSDIADAAKTAWDDIGSFFKSALGDEETGIKGTWNDILSFLKDLWGDVESAAKSVWNDITSFLKGAWGDEETGAKNVWNDILSFLKGVWNDIESAASSAWHSMESTLTSAWNSMYSAVKNIGGDIVNWVHGLPHDILQALSGLGDDLNSFAKNAFQLFLEGAESIGSTIVNWVKGFADDVIGAIKSILGISSPSKAMYDVGVNMMEGLRGGIRDKAEAVANEAKAAAKKASASLHPTGHGGSVEALMKSMAASVGWTGAQWNALYNVEMREAGFDLTARNPGSGAYGLAQFINGPSEYAQYGGNSTTAAGQITGMLNYIKDRYGDPAAAWQHELNYGWYDQGGMLMPGTTLAVNNTGQPEAVIPGGGGLISSLIAALTALTAAVQSLIAAMASSAGASPLGGSGSSGGSGVSGGSGTGGGSGSNLVPQPPPIGQLAYPTKPGRESYWTQAIQVLTALHKSTGYGNVAHERNVLRESDHLKPLPIKKKKKANPGGPIRKAVGGAWPGGWGLVGEEGRELIRLPGGASVMPHSNTEAILSALSAGGVGNSRIALEVHGGQSEFEQFMSTFIKKYVRVHGGGDVQKALGRN